MSDIKLARRLDLSVQYACNREGVPLRTDFRRWLRAAEPGAARITVRIVDEDEGRELNRDYRGKDYATNVLTFAYGEGEDMPLPEGLPLMGDLVLCRQVVEREAAEQGQATGCPLRPLIRAWYAAFAGFRSRRGCRSRGDGGAGARHSRQPWHRRPLRWRAMTVV